MDLMTTKQACEILQCSFSTLRNWADGGIITTCLTPGGHRRYMASSVWSIYQKMVAGTALPKTYRTCYFRKSNDQPAATA